jgi:hypothetical protein
MTEMLDFWYDHYEHGRRITIRAQEELHQRLGEDALTNVIVVDFNPEPEDAA